MKIVSHSEQFWLRFLCFGFGLLIIVSNLALGVRYSSAGTNIEVQFSIPGTAEQGLDRGWLSRDTNMQIGIYGSSANWLEMHQKLAHPRCQNL